VCIDCVWGCVNRVCVCVCSRESLHVCMCDNKKNIVCVDECFKCVYGFHENKNGACVSLCRCMCVYYVHVCVVGCVVCAGTSVCVSICECA
jgi:hypothetical protein